MLVLSRKMGEKISIAGGEIIVTVVRIGPNSVRLGFEAPNDIEILRQELTLTENPDGTTTVTEETTPILSSTAPSFDHVGFNNYLK